MLCRAPLVAAAAAGLLSACPLSLLAVPPPPGDALTGGMDVHWGAEAQEATATIALDTVRFNAGASSIRFETNGGFDARLWVPLARDADWDVLVTGGPAFWMFAQNTNDGLFQNNSPWVRLYTGAPGNEGDYLEFHARREMLSEAAGQWVYAQIPLTGSGDWDRLSVGAPDLHHVNAIEFHADTWGYGFSWWLDALDFQVQPAAPSVLRAYAGDGRVDLHWPAFSDPGGAFVRYELYRDTSMIEHLDGRTPIASFVDVNAVTFADAALGNGEPYHYALGVRLSNGLITEPVRVGPRTPRHETDLQVVSISRTPRYPRYCPEYTGYEVTEPGGFGPYTFSAATGLGCGQTAQTQRFPQIGDTVTFTATVRNRGTTRYQGTVQPTWSVDWVPQPSTPVTVDLSPGATRTFALPIVWTDANPRIRFSLGAPLGDERLANNQREIRARSVGYLTYVDRTYIEDFREDARWYFPAGLNDDALDWLQSHFGPFNAMFGADEPGTKTVHLDVLEVLDDDTPDPATDTQPFAVFPFRFHAGEESYRRVSGYYNPSIDLDYGYLHEMGHQLGLIDLYQLDLPPDRNFVNGRGYSGPDCLMRIVSPYLSEHSRRAMAHWFNQAHGYYGQYLYGIPATCRVRFVGSSGVGVANANVKVYQRCERPGIGAVITDQVKFEGTTDSDGVYTLPNVVLDHNLVPPVLTGDALHDNPFGYVAVVGTNAVFLIRVETQGFVDWAWLDLTEVNSAYYAGAVAEATFVKSVALGGRIQAFPPIDMTENNSADWLGWADAGEVTLTDDAGAAVVGQTALRMETTGCFDNSIRYPGSHLASWDLSRVSSIHFWAKADNPQGFQSLSPTIRLVGQQGYSQWTPSEEVLNNVQEWTRFTVPIGGSGEWARLDVGESNLASVNSLEIHADTWGCGFTLLLDGVGFDPPPCRADFNVDGEINPDDLGDFITCYFFEAGTPGSCPVADFNVDGDVNPDDLGDFITLYFTVAGGGACY